MDRRAWPAWRPPWVRFRRPARRRRWRAHRPGRRQPRVPRQGKRATASAFGFPRGYGVVETGHASTGARGDWMRVARLSDAGGVQAARGSLGAAGRSEEHTSELQSLVRISYAVFWLKKKTIYYAVFCL